MLPNLLDFGDPQAFTPEPLAAGLYQIFWLDRIPGHPPSTRASEIGQAQGLSISAGFVNAVLRGYLRSPKQPVPLDEAEISGPLWVIPIPMVFQALAQAWGEAKAIQLMNGTSAAKDVRSS